MIRSGRGEDRRSSVSRRLPLGVKILVPIFAVTLVTALGSAVFFTFAAVETDRAARATEGREVAMVVQGALDGSDDSRDTTGLVDFLRHVNLAYPNVAAICVLQANPVDPLGPLIVYSSSEPAAACDPGSPLTPDLGIRGISSMTRETPAGSMEETAVSAGLSSTGQGAVVQVLVRRSSVSALAAPTFAGAAEAGLILAVIQTLIVYSVLWASALRPLKRLRLAASAAAHAAQPSTNDPSGPLIRSSNEIDDLSMRFDEMLTAVRDRERELVESHAQLETLITNSPVIVFSADRDGKMLQLRGTGTESLVGDLGHDRLEDLTLLEIAGPNPDLTGLLRRAIAGERVHEVVAVKRRFGEDVPVYLDVIVNPTFDAEHRLSGVTGLAVDVSDRVDAASARAESEQKSAFLAAMSHELRTPLNSIMGFSQLLDLPGTGQPLSAKQKRYVSNILASGSRLLALVGDVLDLAKVGAGQLDVNLEAVALHDVVLDPVDRARGLAAAKSLAIDVFLPPELVAYTDPVRVRQMLYNLLTNAVKFTPNGGGRILVSGGPANGGVEIAVADSGIGIAPEDQEKIFEEFTQIDRGPTRSLDGTGLGLTLTRRLAALLGGTVQVESAPGVGSTFTIWLPGLTSGPAAAEPPAVAAARA